MKKTFKHILLIIITLQANSLFASDGMTFVKYITFSDIIVVGKVVKVNENDFQIRIDEQLKGSNEKQLITVERDPICKCKEYYKLNTTAIFFLFKIEDAHYQMHGNEELVVLLNENICYSSNFKKVTLDIFRTAVMSFSDIFEITGTIEKVKEVKIATKNEELEKYRNNSEFHQFVAEGALKLKQRTEKKNKKQ